MASHVGLTVLHPGGFAATRKLAGACRIDKDTRVIDIACGKGSTAAYLAKRYGCSVVGVDISEPLLNEARADIERKGLSDRVSFRLADATSLPFKDGEFDVAVSQAMLVLIDNKKKTIQEAMRVIKPGGTAGWLELSWQKEPTKEFLKIVSDEICAYCMLNVSTFEGWEKLFNEAGAGRLEVIRFQTSPKGNMRAMITDEGLANTARVMYKSFRNPQVRARMNRLNQFFATYGDRIGYGIYVGNKPPVKN